MGLPLTEVPSPLKSNDWKELFDIIICSSDKPNFFKSKKPFRRWNTEQDFAMATPVQELKQGEVYVGGSVHALNRYGGKLWNNVNDVLYVGDNLGADLVEAKKIHGWQTGLIINELDREIEIQSKTLFQELHFLRSNLRSMLTEIQFAMFSSREITNTFLYSGSSFHDDNKISSQNRTPISQDDLAKRQINYVEEQKIDEVANHISHFSNVSFEENNELIRILEDELQSINTELSLQFNQQFGSMFRTDGHPSLYAYAIRKYADLYMSEVGHFLLYSPSHRFYPPHALHMVSFV